MLVIGLISDVHGQHGKAREILEALNPLVDLWLIAGDVGANYARPTGFSHKTFSNFHTQRRYEESVQRVFDLFDGLRWYVVPGNHDTPWLPVWDIPQNIDRKRVQIEGVGDLWGCGGVAPHCGLPYEWGMPNVPPTPNVSALKEQDPPTLALVHSPPFGVGDKVKTGEHVGSHELRTLYDSWDKTTWVCGHIHEDGGVHDQGKLVNASALGSPFAAHNVGLILIQDGEVMDTWYGDFERAKNFI